MGLNPKRTVAELKEIRALTSDEHGAQRVAWTDTWLKARQWFTDKIKDLPVEHHYDAAGNHWVTLEGKSDKALLLGGHLDSVPNGGWLDGVLDVLAGLEVLRRISAEYSGHPPLTVRLVDWADEEGARFGRSLLGSSAFAGTHSIGADRLRTDKDGVKLEDALRRCGVEIDRFPEAQQEQKNAAAYLELHIEQGPVLERVHLGEDLGIQVALVQGGFAAAHNRGNNPGKGLHTAHGAHGVRVSVGDVPDFER
jgi:N-carbamoyl-L-amino-acid hydrolase